ncbi:hypothetical protein [Pseudomonas sp. So3.2b]|uniref:hypothetical protein n=1 Tax=Pseudomonas sp. So3.2b TaxID=2864101 RepID=UPI001C691018|nr:hypothetical protein [Pseudomonas sp. So3.2b]QYM71559.1 hypothetical protein K1X80_07925 [Pseudomonas sp. So3.2b]
MSKLRRELEPTSLAEALPVPGLNPLPQGFPGAVGATDKTDPKPVEIGPARTFRDTAYTSRVLVMRDGQNIPVIGGLAVACGDDQYEFLRNHPELTPATE